MAFGFETTVVITGPSWESIGAETAITLAKGSPAMLVLLGRDIERLKPVMEKIHAIDSEIVTKFVQIHLDSLKSVRHAAQQILEDSAIAKIHILINNAGIMACPYSKTEDGIERQFATNHIGHFLLTNLLTPKILAASPDARVVNVSSYGNVLSNVLEDPSFNDGKEYVSFLSYGQSKTANVLMALGLNKRLGPRGLKAFALCPGSVPTNLRRFMNPDTMKEGAEIISKSQAAMPQRKTPQQGCATTVRAAIDPNLNVDQSIFLSDTQVTSSPTVVAPYSLDQSNADRVWTLSEKLVGEAFEY
ncbi:hypothetical protein PV08_08915 [Exophiala spinifera]|uniref:Short-chain dehydrogenase n=1 Tax=Exophiala spinifera TaxID=91928 RepID=A0A0D2BR62_9EURO|nr:uncharacterized protein PV08_08915 [Exophiala spinifera]KIW13724.1 hypothetical protein PV08_08915 [Exophiala spinifera]